MILRFLRLFAAFRALEQDRDGNVAGLRETVQEQSTQNLLLRDRLDSVMSDRAKLWEMVETAIGNERETLRMQVNVNMQQRYGVTPYPESVSLPPSMDAEQTPPLTRPRMPSEIIANGNRRFAEERQRRMKARSGPVTQ